MIDEKQKQKVSERYELFKKKFEKIAKMTDDKEITATEKDITKYENKVLIYIRYLAAQNSDEINKRKAAQLLAKRSPVKPKSPEKIYVREEVKEKQKPESPQK